MPILGMIYKGVNVSIIISILGFSFLVFIHELGHFIFARMTGMKVDKFSIGFGPAIYKFGKETVYQIALLPFGGFVQIKGLAPEPGQGPAEPPPKKDINQLMDEWEMGEVFSPVEDFDEAMENAELKADEDQTRATHEVHEVAETEEERVQREAERMEGSFLSKPLWARFLVVSGGPLFNALFTLIVFTVMFIGQSAFSVQNLRFASLVINEVSGAAEAAGLQSGDVLVSIGDEPVTNFALLRDKTINSGGKALQIVVARPPTEDVRVYKQGTVYEECVNQYKGDITLQSTHCDSVKGISLYRGIAEDAWPRVSFNISPENLTPEAPTARYRLGVAPEWERFGGESLGQSVALAWYEVTHLVKMMTSKIVKGVKGEEKVEVASVVKITAISADTVNMGSEWFFNFLAFLSLNLAFLNLLPFPALDGGRLIFLAIEAISRRPVPQKLELIVHGIGIMMLLILTLWVTTKDILSLM